MEFFNFGQLLSRFPKSEIEGFSTDIDKLAAEGRYWEAVNRFLATVPVHAPGLYGEDYFRGEFLYLRALFSAAYGDSEAASMQMDAAGVDLAGDWSDLLFSNHLVRATRIHEHQQQAIASGKPFILVTALPKSGSAFLSNTLAEALDIPLVRSSIGNFPRAVVVPRWIRQIALGGCVTHEHFDGSANNLAPILENGIQHVFVQVRDPRAALWSNFHFQQRMLTNQTAAYNLDALIEIFYLSAIKWIASWLDGAKLLAGRSTVHFIDYRNVRTNPTALCGAVLKISNAERFIPEVAAHIAARGDTVNTAANFRSGKPDEWREHLPAALQDRLWELTSPRVRERMQMQC